MRALIFATALLTATPALAQTPDVAPVVAAERAFAADFPALGLAGSFTKWSQPDAIIIAGGQVVTSATAFADAPRTRQPGEPLIEWWPVFAGIAISGDLGFTTGPAARDQEGYGHYFTVWKRQADGSWKWVYDGGSNASPTGQPGPDSEPLILNVATQGSASPEAAMEEVRAAEQRLADMARTDQKTAHLMNITAYSRFYVAPLAPAFGGEAISAALDSWPATFEFGPTEGGGSSQAGDMVWTYGSANWTRDGISRRGHYVRLWQRQEHAWGLLFAQLIPAPIAAPPPAAG
jgi:hypothetical protein